MTLTVEDKQDIEELLARAAYAYDERDTDMLAACFAEDGEMSIRIAGGDLMGPFSGREAIMGLMTGSMAEQTDVRRHVISNLFFVDDDGPVAISNLTLFATEDGEIRLLSAGLYRDRVKQVDGRWCLANRHLDLDRGY